MIEHIENCNDNKCIGLGGMLFLKMDYAIRVIQRGCANWIDRPITNDGKLGISVRLMYRHLNQEYMYPHEITNSTNLI